MPDADVFGLCQISCFLLQLHPVREGVLGRLIWLEVYALFWLGVHV